MHLNCFGDSQADARRYLSKPFGLLVAIFACLLFACRPQVNEIETQGAGEPTVAAQVTVVTGLRPTPTLVICTSLPTDMTLVAKPVSTNTVTLEIIGLNPGENLILVFHAESAEYSRRIEERPVQSVGPDGSFVYTTDGFRPLRGSTRNHWEIQVVHSRGVACADVTLP